MYLASTLLALLTAASPPTAKSELDKGLLLQYGVGVGVGLSIHIPLGKNPQLVPYSATQTGSGLTPYISIQPVAFFEALLGRREITRAYFAASNFMAKSEALGVADKLSRDQYAGAGLQEKTDARKACEIAGEAIPGDLTTSDCEYLRVTGWAPEKYDYHPLLYRFIGIGIALPTAWKSNVSSRDGGEFAANLQPQFSVGWVFQIPFGISIMLAYTQSVALGDASAQKELLREVPSFSVMIGSTLDIVKSLKL